MRTLKVKGSGRRLKPEDIDRAEAREGFKVPAPYRAFLLIHNGGHPDRCCFRFGSGAYQDSMIGQFLDIRGKGGSLPATIANMAGRYPCHLFPIADDPGGNLILIGTSGDSEGAIYFWDHERVGDESVHRVADSLDAFLDMLTEEEV